MARQHQISFTSLELKALWLLATGARAEIQGDQILVEAGERAIDKVWRAEQGMPRKGHSPGNLKGPRGPGIDVRRAG